MLAIWAVFTVATAVIVYKASRHPLPRHTPRHVYYYFFGVYKASYLVSVAGCVCKCKLRAAAACVNACFVHACCGLTWTYPPAMCSRWLPSWACTVR